MKIPIQCERNKNMFIDAGFSQALRKACNWKKAERLPYDSFYELYVGADAINTIESPDHQIIWGRRGTGKTHLLKAFVQKINEDPDRKEIAFYISCDEVCLQSPLEMQFSNDEEKMKFYAREAFKGFIGSLVELIIDSYGDILDSKYYFKENFDEDQRNSLIRLIDARLEDLLTNCAYGIPMVTKKEKVSTSTSKTEHTKEKYFETGAESTVSSPWQFVASLFGKHNRKKNSSTSELEDGEVKTEYTYSFSFKKTREYLRQIINSLNVDMLYICIDEFWLIDQKRDVSIQPIFFDYLRQVFFNLPKASIKVASIREVTNLNSKSSAPNNFGVQSGHDIHEVLNLDTLYVTEEDRLNHYKKILYSRINYFNNRENTYQDEFTIEYILNALFKSESNLSALITYTHAIPRNFLHVLQKCLMAIDYDLQKYYIHNYLIKRVVISTYLEDKRSNLPMNEGSLFSVINNYINSTQHFFFLLSSDDKKRFKVEIDNLIYVEIIHQIPSAALPINIMDKYKGFYIDSGKFLHTLKSFRSMEDDSIHYNFSYILPESVQVNYTEYVLDLTQVESEFIECPSCGSRISKKNPVYLKASLCPICAFHLE